MIFVIPLNVEYKKHIKKIKIDCLRKKPPKEIKKIKLMLDNINTRSAEKVFFYFFGAGKE